MAKRRTRGGTAAIGTAIVKGVAFLLALLAIAYVITSLALGGVWDPVNWGKKEPKPEKELVAVTTDGEAMYSGESYAMPKGMAFLAAAPRSGSTIQSVEYHGSITMTASISNQYINGKFDWTVEYAGAPQSVAANTYVSVTPTADGAATATVKYLKSCNYQLIIKASLRSLSSETLYDTCTVDFLKTNYKEVTASVGSAHGVTIDDGDFGDTVYLDVTLDTNELTGTIDCKPLCERIKFTVDSDFQTAVKGYLKFDISFMDCYTDDFDTLWVANGEANNSLQKYRLEYDSLTISDFVEGWAELDQTHKEAITFAWAQAYKDLSTTHSGRYDNIWCNYYSNLYYNDTKITNDNDWILYNDEEGIGFGISGATDAAEIAPSVTLNYNVIF